MEILSKKELQLLNINVAKLKHNLPPLKTIYYDYNKKNLVASNTHHMIILNKDLNINNDLYIDPKTLEIRTSTKKQILEYSLTPTHDNTQKVLIQPPDKNHDESFHVYVNTNLKPNKSLVVSYIFEKKNNDLIFTHLNKNDWIF